MTEAESLMLALDYLERHFYTRYLFPIKRLAKFPPCLKDNLETNCSNDPAQIARWAKQFPGCNWGVAHRKSKLLVADIDTNVKKNKQGRITYDELDLMFGWPDTETTTTPSGGFHLVYEGWANAQHPEHVMALGRNGLGLDIDSPNYTLIAGCMFADGTSYVSNGADPVRCPEWIYDTIKSAKTKAQITNANEIVVDLDKPANVEIAIDFLKEDAEPAIEGRGGDFNTYKTAAYLKDLGISPSLAVDLLNEYYNPRCEPPWDREGLERKVASAYAYTNLSKVGGKTAEADFGDDPPDDNFPTKGNPKKITEQKKERAVAREVAAATAPDVRERFLTAQQVVAEYVFVIGIERFVEKANPRVMWKRTAFDAAFAYLPKAKTMSENLLKQKRNTIIRFKDIAYKPGQPQQMAGGIFNTYTQPSIVPMEGDVSWWDAHLEYLFPDAEDRSLVLNWVAWLLQNITKKPKHALLVQGEIQGTGKSFIVEMLSRILDLRNVSNLTQTDLHGDFNGWAEASKLLVIEELRAIDRTEVANKLHPLITQEKISVNEKNLPRRDTENCFGIFAMSNHDAAVTLDQSDRRYLVVNTPAQPRDPEYYVGLYARLDDPVSIAAVAYALMNRDVGAYNGAAAAPKTAAKAAMIDAGLTDLEHFIMDNEGNYPFNGRLLTTEDVIEILPKRLEGRSGRLHATVKSILQRRLRAVEIGQCPLPGGRRVRLMAINGKAGILMNQPRAALGAMYEADKGKAGKGVDIDDDAGSEFAQEDIDQ